MLWLLLLLLTFYNGLGPAPWGLGEKNVWLAQYKNVMSAISILVVVSHYNFIIDWSASQPL